jgi:hypothetical protein
LATFTSAAAFANHVTQYGVQIKHTNSRAVMAAATVAAVAIRQEGSKFKVKGRSGNKFALGAKIEGPYGLGENVIAYVKADPAGMWALIQEGSKPHIIKPRRKGRRGSGGKKALSFGGNAFALVHHPGTGTIGRPWNAGVAKASLLAEKAFEREIVSIF